MQAREWIPIGIDTYVLYCMNQKKNSVTSFPLLRSPVGFCVPNNANGSNIKTKGEGECLEFWLV